MLISIKYVLCLFCIGSMSFGMNRHIAQHATKRKEFLGLVYKAHGLVKELDNAPSKPCNPKLILELHHLNESIKEKTEEMQAFGILDRRELIAIDKNTQSTDGILDHYQQKIARGLKMLHSLQLLHAKIAQKKQDQRNRFPVCYASNEFNSSLPVYVLGDGSEAERGAIC